MFMEQLESRRHFDSAVSGGEGHATFSVDVWKDHQKVGLLQADYYAIGWHGENGSDASSSSGGELIGTQGRVEIRYTPGGHVGDTSGRRLGTDEAGDTHAAHVIAAICGANASALADMGEPVDERMNAGGDYEEYYASDCNCMSFADECAAAAILGHDEPTGHEGRAIFWDQLQRDIDQYEKQRSDMEGLLLLLRTQQNNDPTDPAHDLSGHTSAR
jgi:hypothetical protein